MNQLVFEVEQDDGWFVATCHEPEMATQAQSLDDLGPMIRDLVSCRFEPGEPQRGWPIRLHFLSDPVMAVGA
ncbi:MAG: hypothetical protein KGS61_21370 [Verrucomicrobia bacterium]|nr:hypothetical protein [Verrucomicrobiota bacterium]